MGGDTDRPHARTAAPMWNAERLMEIQMTDVSADVGRPAQPDLRIHIGAVHIDLSALSMDDLAKTADAFLEHAVR